MRNDTLSSSNNLSNDRLVAFFSSREDAFRAIAELKSAALPRTRWTRDAGRFFLRQQ